MASPSELIAEAVERGDVLDNVLRTGGAGGRALRTAFARERAARIAPVQASAALRVGV